MRLIKARRRAMQRMVDATAFLLVDGRWMIVKRGRRRARGWGSDPIIAADFVARVTRPLYGDFIRTALATRQLRMPAGVDVASLADAVFVAPQLLWLDPRAAPED